MIDAMARVPVRVRGTLIEVMAKVSEYLDTSSPHRVARPLRRLLDRLAADRRNRAALEPSVAHLTALCDSLLPRELVGASNVKSGLWLQTAFAKAHDRATLRPHAKDRLFALAPTLVASLPGHVERDPSKREHARSLIVWRNRTLPPTVGSYSPLLDKLVNKHTFGAFEFITLGPKR